MAKKNIQLSVKNLYKDFSLPHERRNSLKQVALNLHRKRSFENFHVLQDINFDVYEGEFFGIVGKNGSGKSTILKLLAGIYQPTKGSIELTGNLTPFIELGVGFNGELTGRENVYLNGAILGMSKKEVTEQYQSIVDFAEIERFMDQKLKNYSSGMQVRLAFSIAIQAHNDILLIDEVLAVGDASFQRKCFNTFKEIKKSGKTVVFVTHDMGAVQEFCDRAMILNNGKVAGIGKSGDISAQYNEVNLQSTEAALDSQTPTKVGDNKKRWGNHTAEIVSIKTLLDGRFKAIFRPKQTIDIAVDYLAHEDILNPIMGITLKDLTGRPIIVTNTKALKIKTGLFKKDQTKRVHFKIENILSNARYSVSPAIASEDAKVFFDWIEDACVFDVGGWEFPAAIVQPDHTINIENLKEAA